MTAASTLKAGTGERRLNYGSGHEQIVQRLDPGIQILIGLVGCMEFDGHMIELMWTLWSDTVLADFRDVEPRRIGTADIVARSEPVFVPQPDHLH